MLSPTIKPMMSTMKAMMRLTRKTMERKKMKMKKKMRTQSTRMNYSRNSSLRNSEEAVVAQLYSDKSNNKSNSRQERNVAQCSMFLPKAIAPLTASTIILQQ